MWAAFVFLFWYVAVPIGLAYLGGLLLTPDAPEAEGDVEGAASRKWSPHTTQQEGLARPRSWGKNLHHGNIIAKWTDVDGDEREVLHLLIDHGDGPTDGVITPIADNTYLNNQPAANFGDSVDVQERVGTMNQTVMTGFEKPKLEYKQNTELLYNVEHIWTTPNTFFDDIEYTICYPYGLMRHRSDGSKDPSKTKHLVRIREHPAGGWTTLFDAYVQDETREAVFKKYVVNTQVPGTVVYGKQYDLSIKRTTANSTSKHTNNSVFRSAREVVDTAFTHPGRALVGIRAVATAKLSGRVDIKVIRKDRIIWNGTTGDLEYNNNRAWVVWDALTLPVIDGDGGANPWTIAHYNGIDPQYLDLAFFKAWATFCAEVIHDGYGSTEPRAACNLKVSEFTDVFSLAHRIAEVGRAYLYWSGNLLTGWIDDTVTTPIDLVTMDTMMSKTWKNSWAVAPELAGRVEVFYEDEKQGYERTAAEWNSDSIANHKNIVSVEGVGLKTRGTAIHYANYLLTRNDLIRNKNKFRVHKDGFRYKLGDTIRLQCRIANWGSAFRVMSSTANTITVDRDASAEVVGGDVIHIRSFNTVLNIVVTDTYAVDSVAGSVITATGNWTVTPVKGNIVAVSPAGAIKLRRIVKLTPTQDNFFNVEVETYDVTLFNADDLDPDNPLADYIWPGATVALDEPLTTITVQDMMQRAIPAAPNIDISWPANITWGDNDPGAGSISWAKTDADEDITFRYKGTSHVITADDTADEFVYWKPAAPTVFSTTAVRAVAFAVGNWLICHNKAGVAYPTTPLQLIHAGILELDTIITEQLVDLSITDDAFTYIAGKLALIYGTFYTAAQVTNFVTSGRSVSVQCSAMLQSVGGNNAADIQLRRTGTAGTKYFVQSAEPITLDDGVAVNISFNAIDEPGAGTHTYTLLADKNINANVVSIFNRAISVLEVKK